MRLIIARHGATAWNAVDRLQGDIDIPLSPLGHQQAEQLARALAHEPLDVIYASALQRTQETAKPIAIRKELAVSIDARLNEFDWGIFKGIPRSERDAHPELGPLWREVQANLHTTNKHKGELFINFEQRVVTVLRELATTHPDQTVLVVAHGAVKRMMIAQITNVPFEELWEQQWQTGSYSIVQYNNGQFTIEQLHVTDHLT